MQGLGDFCVDPDRYLEKTAAKQGPVAGGRCHSFTCN